MSVSAGPPPPLIHPGPIAEERVVALPTRLIEQHVALPAGVGLLDALATTLDSLSVAGAVGRLEGGCLAAFDYYIPAPGWLNGPVATFSDRRTGVDAGSGGLLLHSGGITVGRRDGQVFAHSHALWEGPAGETLAGHLVPESVMLGEGVTARVVTSADVRYEVEPDPETTMSLFMPRRVLGGLESCSGTDGLICRVRPNMDLCTTIEQLVKECGWWAASVWGQVGSLVGGRLVQPDGSILEVPGPATEVIWLKGFVHPAQHGVRADLEAAIVDLHGRVHSGLLARGLNPVAMTFELTLRRE